MILRKSSERGAFKNEWLDSKHTFSFGEYHDPAHMGFSDLRVINEDIVAPSGGFATHPHHDMEIVTFVLSGALEHKDSLGNGSTIRPGDVQRMSAGTGIRHSEFNPSATAPVHLLQIWILPEQKRIAPSYAQENFLHKRAAGKMTLLVSKNGEEGSLTMNQEAKIAVLDLNEGQLFSHLTNSSKKYWVQMASGSALLNGQKLGQGDAAGIEGETKLDFVAAEKSEILVFELSV